MDKYSLLTFLSNSIVNAFNVVETFYLFIALGYPNALRRDGVTTLDPLLFVIRNLEGEFDRAYGFDDFELRLLIEELIGQVSKLSSIDNETADWIISANEISSRSMYVFDISNAPQIHNVYDLGKNRISLPEWMLEPEYQELLSNANRAMEKFIKVVENLLQQLQNLRGGPGADPVMEEYEKIVRSKLPFLKIVIQEDIISAMEKIVALQVEEKISFSEGLSQEVSDLIDAAVEDPNPARSIRRLERAIQKKVKGIHTSSVYLVLGMCYEALENEEKAIENYSKSIELSETARAYYWRGRIYYRQHRYAEARADLQKALSFTGPYSPKLEEFEREQVERFLNDLR